MHSPGPRTGGPAGAAVGRGGAAGRQQMQAPPGVASAPAELRRRRFEPFTLHPRRQHHTCHIPPTPSSATHSSVAWPPLLAGLADLVLCVQHVAVDEPHGLLDDAMGVFEWEGGRTEERRARARMACTEDDGVDGIGNNSEAESDETE
ncbi:hypothetical protein B0H13DRAFT_1855055 [Mycena leptocephala]|nr:hypothetical protein B0H13DRAFT_1855055 [Mycena leptocephala]